MSTPLDRSLAPLGAALALAVASGVAGTVVLRHPSSHPTGAVKPAAPTTATPAPSATVRPPVPRLGRAAVSADLGGGVLVFGGSTTGGGTLLNPQSVLTDQTWTWNGSWSQRHPGTAPSARAGAAMVADPAQGDVLLFGGSQYVPGTNAPAVQLTDTWTWDGSTWTQRHPRHHPGTTDLSRMVAYDVATRQVVLLDNDSATWTWDGADWTEHRVSSGPQVAGAGMMAWDPVTRTVLLANVDALPRPPDNGQCCNTGGNLPTVERTWSWNGSTWVRLHAAAEAALTDNYTVGAYLAADPSGGLLALMPIGGKAGPAPPTLRHWDGHTWSTIPTNADAPINADGLVSTSDGRLLCIDLGDYYEGHHPVQEWSGGDWVVRG